MKRKILLYGRLRDAGLDDSVLVELPARATARQTLAALKAVLGRQSSLLTGCALATEESVLSPSDRIPQRGTLAALPPVCGG
jgi:hypothetical protein